MSLEIQYNTPVRKRSNEKRKTEIVAQWETFGEKPIVTALLVVCDLCRNDSRTFLEFFYSRMMIPYIEVATINVDFPTFLFFINNNESTRPNT